MATKADKADTGKKKHRSKRKQNNRVLGIGADIGDIKLVGSERPLLAVLGGAVIDTNITRTISGVSNVSITVHDPERKLLQKKFLEEKWNMNLDGLHFRYKGMTKNGPDMTLRFVERNAARLQEVVGARKAYRDQVTRAEFILSEVREAPGDPIPVRIFELHKEQPIKNEQDRNNRKDERNDTGEEHTQGEPGLGKADVGSVTVKHVGADTSQIHILDVALDTGMSMGASFKVLVCAVMTMTQESNVSDLYDPEGIGPFSQTAAWRAAGYPGGVKGDIAACARGFFQVAMGVDKDNPDMAKGPLCQAVQRSAFPTAYSQWEDEATKTVETYLGGSGVGSVEQTVKERYAFERGKKESVWKNTNKLAQEVRWRRFMVAGKFFYVPDTFLMQAKRRAIIDEVSSGIDTIDFEHHENIEVVEATVSCRAKYWKVPPGCIVQLGKKMGPAAGSYLVVSIEGSLFRSNPDVEIKLHKPVKPLKEPANETRTKSISVPGGGSSASSLSKVSIPENLQAPGAPGWGGARPVFHQLIDPYMEEHGLSPGSRKEQRPENSGSDHDSDNTSAYATDYPTTSGEKTARELAGLMGFSSWQANSYTSFRIKVDGLQFDVQILWGAAIDHADHVHVGMHRV